MSWFNRSTNPPADASAHVGWIRAASTRNLITQWNETLLRFSEILSGNVLYYPEQQKTILNYIETIKHEWMLVDRQLLTDEEAETMYVILNMRLPQLLMRFGEMKAERNSMSVNHEGNYLKISETVTSMVKTITQLRTKTDAQKLTRYTQQEDTQLHLQAITFPTLSDLPESSVMLSVQLKALWLKLQESVLSVEDEYIVERVATDYLPNSVDLYRTFADAETVLLAQAETALNTQLQVMISRLQSIQASVHAQQLKNLNAQTDFLNERLGKE